MTNSKFISLYIFFCIIATLSNLITQRLILYSSTYEFDIYSAVLFGTIIGLLIKYILDKYWIFNNYETSIKKNIDTFFRYTFFGILTTLIFWFFELSFWFLWKNELAREFGAIIGLSIGYYIKYKLDKKYVFNNNENF
tara:strand:+ start:2520 stop:2933 length:414 start_codon:yes stop_codon:yes gene_type:complete